MKCHPNALYRLQSQFFGPRMWFFWRLNDQVTISLKMEGFFEKYSALVYKKCQIGVGSRGCWIFMGKQKRGYAMQTVIYPNGTKKEVVASRLILASKLGRLLTSEDGECSHLCNQKLCCRPEHLVLEPHSTNMERVHCFGQGLCTRNHHPYCLLWCAIIIVWYAIFFWKLNEFSWPLNMNGLFLMFRGSSVAAQHFSGIWSAPDAFRIVDKLLFVFVFVLAWTSLIFGMLLFQIPSLSLLSTGIQHDCPWSPARQFRYTVWLWILRSHGLQSEWHYGLDRENFGWRWHFWVRIFANTGWLLLLFGC